MGKFCHIQEARVNRRDSSSGEAPEQNIYYPSGALDVSDSSTAENPGYEMHMVERP